MAKKKRTTRRKKATRRTKKVGFAYSIRDLAAQLQRGKSTVSEWTRRPDWPFGSPVRWPVRVPDIEAWIDATLSKGPEDVGADDRDTLRQDLQNLDPLKKARLQKILQETGFLKRKNSRFDEMFVDKAAARQEIAAAIHNTKTAVLAEVRALCESFESMGYFVDGVKKEAIATATDRFDALLRRFAEGMNDAVDRNS